MTQTANDSRLAALRSIATAIRSAMSPIIDADGASAAAREAQQEASQNATTMREGVMGTLAQLASAGAWNVKDIDAAAKMACGDALGNEVLPKSVSTFVGEARRAMHPDVREQFPTLVRLRDDVWNAEKEERKADKAAKTPLMTACARSYHALVGMMGAVIDGTTFTRASDVTAWAEAKDPSLDPKKQADALEAMLAKLAAMAAIFPDPDLLAAVDSLRPVGAEALKAARAELLGREEARLQSHKLAPVPTTVVAETQPNEHADDTAADVVPVVDPLEAALDALAA